MRYSLPKLLLVIIVWVLFSMSFVSHAQNGSPVENQLDVLTPGAWSLAVIPDTQEYAKSPERAKILHWTTRWIQKNRGARNIRAVLQVGDIVNNNSQPEWNNIDSAINNFRRELPYFFAQGNHDIGKNGEAKTRDTHYNTYFDPQRAPLNARLFRESFERGHFENAVYNLDVGKEKFLVMLLEFAPRDQVLAWANRMAKKYRDRKIILLVHEYMDEASRILSRDHIARRSTPDVYGNAHHYELRSRKFWERASKNCGEEIWQKLVSRHSNFEFVFSGHHGDFAEPAHGKLREAKGVARAYRQDLVGASPRRTRVHQFMFNAQWVPSGGDGWIMLVEFSPDGRKVSVRIHSPWLARNPQKCTAPQVGAELWELSRERK